MTIGSEVMIMWKSQKFLDSNTFGCHRLLNSIPKYIELNSEFILVVGFGLGPHPGPRPNIYFLGGEKSAFNRIFFKSNIPLRKILKT